MIQTCWIYYRQYCRWNDIRLSTPFMLFCLWPMMIAMPVTLYIWRGVWWLLVMYRLRTGNILNNESLFWMENSFLWWKCVDFMMNDRCNSGKSEICISVQFLQVDRLLQCFTGSLQKVKFVWWYESGNMISPRSSSYFKMHLHLWTLKSFYLLHFSKSRCSQTVFSLQIADI